MFNKKAVFINTASQIIVRFVTLGLTLVSVKLLASYLGTSGLGSYNTVTTYINFFIVLADLGLFSVTVREIAKNRENEKKVLSNVFVVRLISALLASLAAIIIVFLTNYSQEIKFGTLLGTGFLFFNLLGSVYDMVLQSRLKMQYSALAEFLSKLLSVVALYIIVLFQGSFLVIMSTVALYGLFIFVFKWLFSRRYVVFGPEYNKEIAKWIFGLSWPIGIVFIMNNIFMKIDTLMVFGIKGSEAAGIYTVAYKVLEVSAFIGAYFANSLKPSISQYIHTNKIAVVRIIQKGLNVALFLATPITLAAVIFSREIILFLSTPEFLSGSLALVLLSLALPFIFFDALLAEIYIANDERRLMIKIFIFIVSFNIILNSILIPIFSFSAAAFTTLLSEIVLLSINLYFTKKIVDFNLNLNIITKIVLAGVLTFTFVKLFLLLNLGIHFLIMIALIFVIYALWGYILRIISPKELFEMLKK